MKNKIYLCHPGESRDPGLKHLFKRRLKTWIPAFAGMTVLGFGLFLTSCRKHQENPQEASPLTHAEKYHCPMHPTYVSDKPGDCPICHMRLVPMKAETSSPATESAVPGYARVSLSMEKQQKIGVRTALVEKRNLHILVRASGRVAYDPDLYNAIIEHREALKAKAKLGESPSEEMRNQSDSLLRSSALRLRQMGFSEDQIEKITAGSDDPTNLLIGGKDSVWVYADLYEYESGLVKKGQRMEVTSNAFPGQRRSGTVVAVDAVFNPTTRTLRARGEISNPDGLLKSDMYVDAAIHVDLGRRLAIPEAALLETGTRQIVFVESAPGEFEPREVRAGRQAEGYFEILSGLQEGEKVVNSANFLIDSESRIKAAVSGASGPSH